MKKIILSILLALVSLAGYAQIDTVGIYGERQDSLGAAVFVERQQGSYLRQGKAIRTEVISAALATKNENYLRSPEDRLEFRAVAAKIDGMGMNNGLGLG